MRLVKTEIVPLSREYVDWFANLPTYRGDRDRTSKKGQRRVAWLRNLLEQGHFHTPKWALAHYGNATYRVNGGHSSLMLSQANGFPRQLSAVVDHFEVQSERELAELFGQFDNTMSSRSRVERVTAHAAVHRHLDDVPRAYVAAALAGVAAAMSGMGERRHLDGDAVARLVHEEKDFLVWTVPIMRCAFLRRTPVIAAVWSTYTIDRNAASRFWDEVRSGSGAPAARKLHDFLRELRMSALARRRWDPRAVYAKCIHAWNAWRRGADTTLSYYANAALPEPF